MKIKIKKYPTKAIFCGAIIFLFFLLMGEVFFFPFSSAIASYNYTPLESIPGFGKTADFPTFVLNFYKFGIWAVGIAALFMLTVGGFMYMTSSGNMAKNDSAKTVIWDSIIGLVLALAAYLILYIINPDLVKINVGMKGLTETAGTGSEQSSGGSNCSYAEPKSGQNICDGASCGTSCDTSKYDSYITKYAKENGLSEKLVKAVLCRESGGNPNAVSDKHACGLMQVLPSSGDCNSDPRDLMDPEKNIKEGAKILKQKYITAGNYSYSTVTQEQMALAAYNCCANGENPNASSKDCGGIVPKWACPTNPGTGKYNMCNVKDYACSVSKCAS